MHYRNEGPKTKHENSERRKMNYERPIPIPYVRMYERNSVNVTKPVAFRVHLNVNDDKMMSKSSLFYFVRSSRIKTHAAVTDAKEVLFSNQRFFSSGGVRPPSYREQYAQGVPFGRRQLNGKEQQLALQAVVGKYGESHVIWKPFSRSLQSALY